MTALLFVSCGSYCVPSAATCRLRLPLGDEPAPATGRQPQRLGASGPTSHVTVLAPRHAPDAGTAETITAADGTYAVTVVVGDGSGPLFTMTDVTVTVSPTRAADGKPDSLVARSTGIDRRTNHRFPAHRHVVHVVQRVVVLGVEDGAVRPVRVTHRVPSLMP